MIKLLLAVMVLSAMNGCSSSPRYHTGPVKASSSKTKKDLPSLKTKKKGNHRKTMTGVSSFYAEAFHGKLTANGEVYDMYGVTAAHKTLPLNTVARVTNLENNKSLILRINDRGPYVKGRILDCSYGAAKKLDFINNGTAKVKIEVIDWGDNKYMKHRN
ncbi:MAG: septal ring lytic transglycosylase RlpA family protein [Fidelibacterota bacterium]